MSRTVPVGPAGGAAGYITITLPAGAAGAAVPSAKISNNTGVHQGAMVGFKVKALPCANAINFTLKISDRDGDVIYTSGNNASHAVTNIITVTMGLNIPLMEQEIITITGAGEPGATGLIVRATLYYNPDADIIAWGFR